MLSDQWYVAMSKPAPAGTRHPGKSLAQVALEASESGAVNIFPSSGRNGVRQWMENIQDWCISRQLWWGHQIPAWYDEAGNVHVARQRGRGAGQGRRGGEADTRPGHARHLVLERAGAVLHPRWPQVEGEEATAGRLAYDLYLPSSGAGHRLRHHLLLGGADGGDDDALHGRVPFRDVYIHGIVRDCGRPQDEQVGGQPRSTRSTSSTASPRGAGEEEHHRPAPAGGRAEGRRKIRKHFPRHRAYGADALRFTMAAYATLGRNIKLST